MQGRLDVDDTDTKDVLKDLDPPTSSGSNDAIVEFEQSLPFNRIEITELIKRADIAA